MVQQIPLDSSSRAAETETRAGLHDVAADIAYLRLMIVNAVFIGAKGAGDRGWVLVDTGVPGSAPRIIAAAAERFAADARPAAILLTHGHFDHTGTVEELAAQWDAPVYAHPLEHPYLRGDASYPPPDPSVGGGILALSAGLFPTSPVNVGKRLRGLTPDCSVPHLADWRWLHVPGHSPGQVAFWRERDHTLIAADAVITTAQESAYAVAVQAPEMHGPPMYFTTDWQAAKRSAAKLAALEPELLIAGHGRAMRGAAMREALHRLVREFDTVAVPEGGRYVDRPARADDGSAYRRK